MSSIRLNALNSALSTYSLVSLIRADSEMIAQTNFHFTVPLTTYQPYSLLYLSTETSRELRPTLPYYWLSTCSTMTTSLERSPGYKRFLSRTQCPLTDVAFLTIAKINRHWSTSTCNKLLRMWVKTSISYSHHCCKLVFWPRTRHL